MSQLLSAPWEHPWAVGLGVVGLLLLARAMLAVVARPQRGVLVLAALLPFDGLLLVVPGGPALGPWKEALLLGVLLATFFAPDAARRQDRGQLPGWVLAAAAFAALGVASGVVVGGLIGLWGVKVGYFYLLVPVILWRCPFDRGERGRLVTVLMTTGLLTAVVGLAQQWIGPSRLAAMGYEYNEVIRFAGGFLRSFSTFTQPFSFGLFVTLVLLVCLPVALSEISRPRNALFLVTVPILVAGMAASVVRGAILGLVAGGIFLLLWRYRGFVHLLLPAGLVLLVLPTTVYAAFLSSSSLGQRTTGWSEVLDKVVAAPLGNGIGRTGASAEKAIELGADPSDVLLFEGSRYQPDNQYVKTLLELGPLGLWLLLLVGAAGIVSAVRIARQSEGNDRALAEGVAASMVGAAATALVSTYLEIFPLDFYFWLLLGVLLCYGPPSTSTLSPSARAEVGSRPTSGSSSGP